MKVQGAACQPSLANRHPRPRSNEVSQILQPFGTNVPSTFALRATGDNLRRCGRELAGLPTVARARVADERRLVDGGGIEPPTSALRTQRSPS